jgi:hypothetical protein
MTTINPQDEIDEVRANCGGAGESNLPEADIDMALSMANEETTERTGLLPTDPRLPHLRRKMKLLIATAYLLTRFSDMDKVRDSITREVRDLTNTMKVLESTDEDEESLIDSNPYDYEQVNQVNYWGGAMGGTKKSINRHRNPYSNVYPQDYEIIRIL